jgi:Flp pilus assembly protein TadG
LPDEQGYAILWLKNERAMSGILKQWKLVRLRSRRGQQLVEFAFVAPILFLMIFGIIDFGRLFFTQMTLQNALRQAGRFAVTGNKLPDPSNPANMLSRVDSIIATARSAATGLEISNIQISSAQGGTTGAGRAGGPGDMITISLAYDLPLITPLIGKFFGFDNTYHFTVRTTFRNEPFPPNQTS